MDFPVVELSFWVMDAEEIEPCLVDQAQGVRVMQTSVVFLKSWLDGTLSPWFFPNPRRGCSAFARGTKSFGNRGFQSTGSNLQNHLPGGFELIAQPLEWEWFSRFRNDPIHTVTRGRVWGWKTALHRGLTFLLFIRCDILLIHWIRGLRINGGPTKCNSMGLGW